VACGARLRGTRLYDALQEEVRRLRQEIDGLKQSRVSQVGGDIESKLFALEREAELVVEALKKLERERARAWQEIVGELESSISSLKESMRVRESRSIPLGEYAEPYAQPTGPGFYSPEGAGPLESIFGKLRLPSARSAKSTVAAGLAATTVMTLFLALLIGVGAMRIPILELLGSPFAPPELAPALGIVVHYSIGVAWAVVFVALFRKARFLRGLIFSIIQTALAVPFMAFVILPLSKMPMGADFAQMVTFTSINWLIHFVYAMALVASIRIMRS